VRVEVAPRITYVAAGKGDGAARVGPRGGLAKLVGGKKGLSGTGGPGLLNVLVIPRRETRGDRIGLSAARQTYRFAGKDGETRCPSASKSTREKKD